MNITQPLDDQSQSLLIVPHMTQEEHHLRYQIPLLTDLVSKFEIVLWTRTQEVDQPMRSIVRVQLHLRSNIINSQIVEK